MKFDESCKQFLDCDVFLTNEDSLEILRSVNEREGYTDQLGVFAPLLNSASTQSNFWLDQIDYNYREAKQDELQA
jgi:hypothetical protein